MKKDNNKINILNNIPVNKDLYLDLNMIDRNYSISIIFEINDNDDNDNDNKNKNIKKSKLRYSVNLLSKKYGRIYREPYDFIFSFDEFINFIGNNYPYELYIDTSSIMKNSKEGKEIVKTNIYLKMIDNKNNIIYLVCK